MKRYAILTLAVLMLSATAMADGGYCNNDLHGRYVMHEEGSYINGGVVSTRTVGIINADGKGKLSGWEYSYALPATASLCKFGISGKYDIAADGHLEAYITYQRFASSPAICGNGPLGSTWEGGVDVSRNHVAFAEHDDYGIASGELSR